MRLKALELNNFRQFYGKQNVEFASTSDDGRTITVFHGFNGAGKTALLNAFVWCLYGETTPDLENPDRMVNEQAFADAAVGSEVSCYVALVFDFRDETYRAERSFEVTKTGGLDASQPRTSFRLTVTNVAGETESFGNNEAVRQHRVEQMLPRSLYPFFFFNGERVERLAAADAYERVESGVKTLLDIEIYERGAVHLRQGVTRQLAEEAKKLGDKHLAEAMGLLEQKQDEEAELSKQIDQANDNVKALEAEQQTLERRLEQLRTVAALAERRKQLKVDERDLSDTLDQVNSALAAAISKSGYLAFAQPVLEATENQVASARKRGDIPAKIKPQFVDDLLEKRQCVCGRPIEPDSPEEHCLHAWRQATGLAELEEKIVHVSADVRTLRERREDMFRSVDEHQKQLQSVRAKLRACRAEITVIEEQIAGGDYGDEAAQIQDQMHRRKIEQIHEQASVLKNKDRIVAIQNECIEIRKRTAKLESQTEKAALAKRQLESVQRVADALARIRDIQKDDVRRALNDSIREIWNDAAIKDYEASVSSDYRLLLTKTVGGLRQNVSGASTGEKQVLALSFVGALVRKARENVEKHFDVDHGGYFPLVMDSPFGSLEDDYRRKVAEWLPNLANQVIVMASKTQWRNEVESAMRSRIGREYVLELHTPKRATERTIDLHGTTYPYVVESDGAEMTTIRRVS